MRKMGVIIFCFIIAQSVMVFSASTIKGPTGLVTMPTAEALKYKEVDFSLDYDISSASKNINEIYYKVNLGTFKNWELGIVGGTVPTEGVFLNAKYYLISDASRYPLSLAIGLQNLASRSSTNLYLVATQKFQGGLTGSLGFNFNFSIQDASLMAGLEYFATNQISLVTDVKGENKNYLWNAGLRYYLLPDLHVRVACLDITNVSNTFYTFGISYSKFL